MISRREFAATSALASIFMPFANAQGASSFTRNSPSIDLAVAYYEAYNEGNWLAVSNICNDRFRFKTNSGYYVQAVPPNEDGISSGYEKTPDGVCDLSQAIDFLRERRLKTKGSFYLREDRSEFFSPNPRVAICWTSKPGVTGSFGFPIPEVHIFQCEIKKVGEAITEAKIWSLVEVNIQNFEYS